MDTYNDGFGAVEGYRWIQGDYVLAKLVCIHDKPVAYVSRDLRAGVRTGGYEGRVIEWVQFNSLENAKQWCETMVNTGAN